MSPAAADQLFGDLRALATPGPLAPGVQRLDADFDEAVAAGQVTGSSIGSLQSAITSLAAAAGAPLPASPPAPSTQGTATRGAGIPPLRGNGAAGGAHGGAPGDHHGEGQGFGEGHGHGHGGF